jgi:hypothetical protein
MKEKIKVGQTVWIYRNSPYSKEQPLVTKMLVSKIGNKYFYVGERGNQRKFDFECNECVETGYMAKCFLSKKEIDEHIEHIVIELDIKSNINKYHKLPYSLDQLRRINKILNETNN